MLYSSGSSRNNKNVFRSFGSTRIFLCVDALNSLSPPKIIHLRPQDTNFTGRYSVIGHQSLFPTATHNDLSRLQLELVWKSAPNSPPIKPQKQINRTTEMKLKSSIVNFIFQLRAQSSDLPLLRMLIHLNWSWTNELFCYIFQQREPSLAPLLLLGADIVICTRPCYLRTCNPIPDQILCVKSQSYDSPCQDFEQHLLP